MYYTRESQLCATKVRFQCNSKMTLLPSLLKELPNLKHINAPENLCKTINLDVIANPHLLTHISMPDCRLEEIPIAIGLCKNLQMLNVASNFIKKLPRELYHSCTELSHIYVERNPLESPFDVCLGWVSGSVRHRLGLVFVRSDLMRDGIMHFLMWWNKTFRVKPVGKIIAQQAWEKRWKKEECEEEKPNKRRKN